MKYKISVIIPVYNVERYIKRCLDSVLNQAYENLEVLLIDDGSTDKSGKICDAYALNDARIKVFHKENGGVSSALNIGLDNFTGNFVGFVDSDDWIEPNMFHELLSAIKNVDIAVCSYFTDSDLCSDIIKNMKDVNEQIIDTENMLLYPLMRDYYMGFCGYMWNKLFRRELFKDLRFDENLRYAQDVLLYSEIVKKYSAKGRYINKPLYHHIIDRDDSITKTKSFDIKNDVLTVYKRVEELLPHEYKYWARGFYCYHASVICDLARKKRDKEMLVKMQGEIKAHYDDYVRTNKEFPEKFSRMEELMSLQTL